MSFRDLVPEAAEELTNVVLPVVERAVRRADRQIGATKQTLNAPGAAGLLIVCHNGNYGLSPEAVINLIGRALKNGEYNSIDQVIYFVSGMKIQGQDGSLVLPWIPACRKGYKDIPMTFFVDFIRAGSRWNRRFSAGRIVSFTSKADKRSTSTSLLYRRSDHLIPTSLRWK